MLLSTSMRTTTARYIELIDHIKLTIFKNAQITHNSLRNSKNTLDYPKACVTHSYSSIAGGAEGICLTILVLYHLLV